MTRIKKSFVVVGMAASLAVAFAAGTLVNAPGTTAQAQVNGGNPAHHHGREHHSVIRRGMHLLKRAVKVLSHGAHDFGGHRVQAIDLTKQAIEQLHAAMQFDHH